MIVEILDSLVKLSPLVASLILFIYFLYKRNQDMDKCIEKKDEEIKELNLYIRKNDKDNQLILSQVASTLDKVIENEKHNVDDIKHHISMLIMMNKNKEN